MGAGTPGHPEATAYPVSLPMQGRLAVVVGGGCVAARRVAGLRAAGADVVVVAPELSTSLAELASGGLIIARRRGYDASDLDGAWLVLACTGQRRVNATVAADAERARIWCIRTGDTASDERPGTAPEAPAGTAPERPAGTAPPQRADTAPGQRPGTARLARRVLVLGGARSGKSASAEAMLAGYGAVDYVATGPLPGAGDPEWDERVRDHQERRPAHWRTEETLDVARVLAEPGTAVPALVDCLSTWLARVMDDCGVWSGQPGADRELAARADRLVTAWQAARRPVVAVSNEVGSGVVPATASGRRYRDELGRLNARIAAGSSEVWLCTAGIAQRLR